MPEPTFLTQPQVQARYQKSHVTLWRWAKSETMGFPAPVKFAGYNHWKLADLEAWEAKQVENA